MVRRVLALVLLGVVVVVCAALAASESLRNDSRKTASAVTIQFSDSVRITSWDTSTFATCSPSSGRASTFRFSGGQLENGGRFSISWTPSAAEITSADWETTGAASSGSTASGAPLTYEEIMAQIARYPGPDEPLYVPAEGEQIWLTDLEGHADIYDNDSIKINYAPGFDKSQITRIDVYRNGIKLRFVPALFDILTNEQMKTFDGNPTEYAPKSAHSDHAIVGYEYSLRFTGAALALARSPLPVRIASAYTYGGTRTLNIGTVFQALEWLPDRELIARLSQYREMGFSSAQVDVEYYLTSSSSNAFFGLYEVTPSIAGDWERTLTAPELQRILDLAAQAGLSTEVRVQLLVSREAPSSELDRSQLRPSDVDEWFRNYTIVCRGLARIAEAGGAKVFCVGVELTSMEKYAAQWRALAADLRSVFAGSLTFCEATHTLIARDHAGELIFERAAGQFWDAYDLIEFSCWPMPNEWWSLETQRDQRFSVLVGAFVAHWQDAFAYYRAAYPEKPIRFGEMGTYTQDGVAAGLWDYVQDPTWPVDHQEMADVWAAELAGAEILKSDGVTVWSLTPACLPWEQGCFQGQAGGFFLMASPALRTITGILLPT